MSEPARAAAAPSSIEDHRAERKPKAHRWTRWRRELPKRFGLSATALELASELARRADNETGECWGYQARIAADIGRSSKTVQRATAELVNAELVVYWPGGQRRGRGQPQYPSRFRLVPLEGVRSLCPQEAVTESTRPGGNAVPDGRSLCPQEAVTESTLTAVRTTKRTDPPGPPKGGEGAIAIGGSRISVRGSSPASCRSSTSSTSARRS